MEEKRMQEDLSVPIVLTERLRSAVEEADSFKKECFNIRNYAEMIFEKLWCLVRFTGSVQSFYDRPVRRIVAEVYKNLDRALTLVRKCKRRSALCQVVTIISAAEIRKVKSLLEASVGDIKWLESILGFGSCGAGDDAGIVLTLPPIASNDPILAWV